MFFEERRLAGNPESVFRSCEANLALGDGQGSANTQQQADQEHSRRTHHHSPFRIDGPSHDLGRNPLPALSASIPIIVDFRGCKIKGAGQILLELATKSSDTTDMRNSGSHHRSNPAFMAGVGPPVRRPRILNACIAPATFLKGVLQCEIQELHPTSR